MAEHAIGERLLASMLAWRHSGFSVHNAVRVRAGDVAGRKKLAQCMLRAPFFAITLVPIDPLLARAAERN